MNRYLLNFAASYMGGGRKRMLEYVSRFAMRGGANFILHERARELVPGGTGNRYFFVNPSIAERLFDDCGYLESVLRETGPVDFYYSYGIPMPRRVARVNWLHISNVLPFAPSGIDMGVVDRLKMRLLGSRLRSSFANADIISAESRYAVGLLGDCGRADRVVSVNGSDDEFAALNRIGDRITESNDVVVVGTYKYKALLDSFTAFSALNRESGDCLTLRIIGDPRHVPSTVSRAGNVDVMGLVNREIVVETLCRARYYISTTTIENSYNAASEGVFLSRESYISDIEPHRELLKGMSYELRNFDGISRPLLHVRRTDMTTDNIRTWDQVINEMLERVAARA